MARLEVELPLYIEGYTKGAKSFDGEPVVFGRELVEMGIGGRCIRYIRGAVDGYTDNRALKELRMIGEKPLTVRPFRETFKRMNRSDCEEFCQRRDEVEGRVYEACEAAVSEVMKELSQAMTADIKGDPCRGRLIR